MVRELAICLYLLCFKFTFNLFNLFPLKNKTTFVISFGDNSQYVFEEMRKQGIQTEVVFLCKGRKIHQFIEYEDVIVIPFETMNVINWIRAIFHLATSKNILVDNYFGFLAAVKFKEGVKCIQLWHASGAIKKFGLEDESNKFRSAKANQRFLQVYSKFDQVIVGSEIMADIFMKSFNLTKRNILPTGIPRTDFYFNEAAKQQALQTLVQNHPILLGKKVILYAPTYRDQELDHFNLMLDVETMYRKLGNDYLLVLRLHPAVKNAVHLSKQYPDFMLDLSSSQYDINHLLLAADYLITDYSSIPYDFSLLRKPMIFFAYDLQDYKETRGIVTGFEENLPGPVVSDTKSIIELIKNNRFDFTAIDYYADKWNQYSKGHSSENLVIEMFGRLEKSQTLEQIFE